MIRVRNNKGNPEIFVNPDHVVFVAPQLAEVSKVFVEGGNAVQVAADIAAAKGFPKIDVPPVDPPSPLVLTRENGKHK